MTRPKRQMTEQQPVAALSGVWDDNAVWLAINQLFDEALFEAGNPWLAKKGTHPGGRLAALGELKGELHRRRTTAARSRARGKEAEE